MDESSIYNYKLLTEGIATSGQPTEDELIYIVNAGYTVVINLGLHNAEYSVKNESSFFKSANIKYIHIPVIFDEPKQTELMSFIKTLDSYKDSKVFVHCAANKRVSVFIALYRIISLGWTAGKAIKELKKVWLPNEIWQSFIDQQLTSS
jgi:protein tyrosine phosphatase (PTP) superfamily phosphohydrolase (DUF442 family)